MKLATTIMLCSVAKAKTLTVMVGIPGSGKTTKAMQLAAKNSNSVLLSRDTLRKEISFADESNLTAHMVQLASTALEAGKDVIVDSPNLDKSDISAWTSLAVQHKAKLNTVHMNTPLGIAVNRDAKRPHPVGLAKIKSMLKAVGTSEGNKKGWDTRGRGRKSTEVPSKEKQTEAVNSIKHHLEMIDKFRGAPPEGFKYTKESFLLKYGQSFNITSKTLEGKRGEVHGCYMNAYRAASNNPDLTYCEGCVHIGVFPIDHAWVVDKQGNVIDPTLRPRGAMPPLGYFGVPFKQDFVYKQAMNTRVYGVLPWPGGKNLYKGDAKDFKEDV